MEFQHPLLHLGSTPVPGDAPCGINAKYEPDFESLEAELAKQESLNAEKVDWNVVNSLSSSLLENTTKDYLAASYLAHSLTLLEGYSGLYAGIRILNDITEQFWSESFPPVKRLRARQTALEWLSEKSNAYIEANPPAASDNELVVALASAVKDLDFALADKMGDKSPSFVDLNRALKRLKQSAEYELKQAQQSAPAPAPAPAAPQPEAAPQATAAPAETAPAPESSPAPAPEPAPQPAPQPAPAAPAPAAAPAATSSASAADVMAPVGAIASEADAKKAYKKVQEALRALADFHGAQKASDPRRYRYSRSALWDSLDKLPPNKDGKTQLPKPPADKLKKLQEQFDQGNYTDVLEQAEKSAAKMPYWFDGQRLIANSLEALGGEYAKAHQVFMEELSSFIRRLPQIPELCYSDGTPFADEQTQFWISTQVMADNSGGGNGQAADELSEAITEAQKLVASGKIQEGLNLVSAVPARNTRDQFRSKLACAELVANSGQVRIAIPLLERLIGEAEKISAPEWESDFLVRSYELLVQSYDKLDDAEADDRQDKRNAAFEQLCWLNPTAVAE